MWKKSLFVIVMLVASIIALSPAISQVITDEFTLCMAEAKKPTKPGNMDTLTKNLEECKKYAVQLKDFYKAVDESRKNKSALSPPQRGKSPLVITVTEANYGEIEGKKIDEGAPQCDFLNLFKIECDSKTHCSRSVSEKLCEAVSSAKTNGLFGKYVCFPRWIDTGLDNLSDEIKEVLTKPKSFQGIGGDIVDISLFCSPPKPKG